MKYQTTTNYNKFKFKVGNREINRRHVAELKASMMKDGFDPMFPVIIDNDWYIQEGQHRFVAGSELGLPIPYKVGRKMTSEEIRNRNSTSKNWSSKDYIHSFAESGNVNYKNLLLLQKKYPSISLSSLLSIAAGHLRSTNFANIKSGSLQLPTSSMEDMFRACDFIIQNKDKIKLIEGLQTVIVPCIAWVILSTNVDKTRLSNVLKRGSTFPAVSQSAPIRFLETLTKEYNKSLPKGSEKRIIFDAEYKQQELSKERSSKQEKENANG